MTVKITLNGKRVEAHRCVCCLAVAPAENGGWIPVTQKIEHVTACPMTPPKRLPTPEPVVSPVRRRKFHGGTLRMMARA